MIRIGSQVLCFRENTQTLVTAAATGSNIACLSTLLDEPLAEFVSLVPAPGSAPRYPLRDQQVTFGRKSGTYVFPADRLMSSRHARVYQRGENHFVEDLGSRNGTYVKVRVKSPVPAGSAVMIGGQILQVNRL